MYDLAVIGAGWAGFNAAIRARELGLKVALIEKDKVGGTCLNRGCIPTKALIQSAKIYSQAKKSANFGIEGNNPQVNFFKIQERKDKIVQQLQNGMQFRLKGIDFLNGQAQIFSPQVIKVGSELINTKFILVATGSRPVELGELKFDGKKIISSDEILNLREIPKSLLIIGGGVIGCEFASLFSALGSSVAIVELMPQILPGIDKEVTRKLENIFKKKGIKVSTATDAKSVDLKDYDLVLLSIGRQAETKDLSLEKFGVKLEKGKILVDEYLKTSVSNIYAAGDCTGQIMLAHFAAYQGCVAAENIAHPDKPKKAQNTNIPNCIFTDPEIASVGLSQEEALGLGLDARIDKFDFLGSGMARILDETEGFVKIISDKENEQILGVSIIGPRSTELIGILTLAMQSRLKISQIRDTVFAHPTLSESIREAVKTDYAV